MAKASKLPIDISDLELTPSEIRFVGIYCSEANMDESVSFKKAFPQRAKGMDAVEIRLAALELLNTRQIKIAVQRFVDSVIAPWQDKLEHQLLSVLRTRAFFNVRDFFHDDGSPKKLSEIPDELMICVDSVAIDAKGKNADVYVTSLKIADRVVSMKMLQDLLKKKNTIDGEADEIENSQIDKKRLQEIFAGVEKGLEIGKKLTKPVIRNDNLREDEITVEAEEIDPEPSTKQIEANINTSPVVQKARELASKTQSGINVDQSPLVQEAVETVSRFKVRRNRYDG